MIGHGDGEPLDRRVARRPLRYSPTLQHAADLKPEIPMQVARVMLLHDEPRFVLPHAHQLLTSTLQTPISLSVIRTRRRLKRRAARSEEHTSELQSQSKAV